MDLTRRSLFRLLGSTALVAAVAPPAMFAEPAPALTPTVPYHRTIRVPEDYRTIQLAMQSINTAQPGWTYTIHLGDGTYRLPKAIWSHPAGRNIRLKGNGRNSELLLSA